MPNPLLEAYQKYYKSLLALEKACEALKKARQPLESFFDREEKITQPYQEAKDELAQLNVPPQTPQLARQLSGLANRIIGKSFDTATEDKQAGLRQEFADVQAKIESKRALLVESQKESRNRVQKKLEVLERENPWLKDKTFSMQRVRPDEQKAFHGYMDALGKVLSMDDSIRAMLENLIIIAGDVSLDQEKKKSATAWANQYTIKALAIRAHDTVSELTPKPVVRLYDAYMNMKAVEFCFDYLQDPRHRRTPRPGR